MVEFTGERVIPGEVNDDLWNEHVARYAFARLYAKDKRVLDAGCGTGYGSAELALDAASVTALDVDPQAAAYCRANFPAANLRAVAASCTAIPFPANAFDLIVAFEVIEHLKDYRALLDECARVLTHQGLFVVSSPNKRYYAESRANTGANPYHQHEFEPDEFESELARVFSNVRLLLQNRSEAFAFHSPKLIWPAQARVDGGGGKPEEAHFLIGLCSFGPLPEPRSFVYVPKAANVLREREQHIQLLDQELGRTKGWLAETQAERDSLLALHRELQEELESRNRWAEKLDAELQAAGQRVMKLQDELAAQADGYETKIGGLEEENRGKTAWALSVTQELQAKCDELAECVRLLETAEATVVERTQWAQRAESLREELAAKLQMVRSSRWVRLGRTVGLGPVIDQP
ncbi:MAG: methyltransferase domain-containing protein [Acidobacteriia bacterium]|nr:methyltransferase domain-containing protein [Terriglobia bacterium]